MPERSEHIIDISYPYLLQVLFGNCPLVPQFTCELRMWGLCAGGGEAEGVEEGEGVSEDCFQAMMSASWRRGFVLMS